MKPHNAQEFELMAYAIPSMRSISTGFTYLAGEGMGVVLGWLATEADARDLFKFK